MSVNGVKITADAYLVCLTHALSTEKEEIMGLLIGEIDENRICCVSAVILLRRSDKQADRVEISPEQLSDASTQAERLAHQLQRPMRVVGWYHSHPHITVWPSHVDVQTQSMYQMMDEGFVGLIFSVFNQEKSTKHNRIQVTCFQSINQSPEGEPPQLMRLEVPLYIAPADCISKPCLDSLVNMPRILCQEEEECYLRTTQVPDMDLVFRIHNGAVFTEALCHIMEVISGPLMQTLEHRLQQNKAHIAELRQEKEELEKQLADEAAGKISDSTRQDPESPYKTTSV
ncbi:hypothetical protein LSH36_256g06064 [Paralvinella palmiformis]|uniref:MPN domain-containing protein n=1 Tax=Paralvinella palmiformis TaxID=53620 RepID=A0AAD9N2L1_9ANNE|nr:hypothetical protein LSH36_256g06064 [Paralvinella palmiformis]